MQKATNDEIVESISSLLASASFKKGEKIFNKCGACHNYKKELTKENKDRKSTRLNSSH